MGINVLSLFDGISCGKLAIERAGFEVDSYFSSEIDPNAIEISQKNHPSPNIIRLGDVTKIGIHMIKALPKIDLVLAGSPCQGFSRNGKGLNFDDPRSKLFFDFVEILAYVKLYNPKAKFLLENVHMKKEWESIITEYVGVKEIDINSKLVSAQNRPRNYWTDIENVEQPEDRGILLKNILEDDPEGDYINYHGLKVCSSYNKGEKKKPIELIQVVNGEVRISQATKQGYIVANDGDGVNISFPTSSSRRGRVIKQKSSTLDRSCNTGVFINGTIRPLTITELERLQTLPEGYTDNVSLSARKSAIGNGWTVDIITHILKSFSCG